MESSRGPPRVKNKSAAPVQISAEQLLREAVDRQEVALQAPTQRFADLEELHEYQGRKRRDFEDYVRRNRVSRSNWLRYAQWELEQKEFSRARSVFERALDVHPNDVEVWVRYCEAEMKSRNINHARNLLDRAVTHLPRCDKLWYKYVYMEEMLGNLPATRHVFDRWMAFRPDEAAWAAYIKLEKRYGEWDRARNIFAAFTVAHPKPHTWLKWAKFEEEYGTGAQVRDVFQRAVDALGRSANAQRNHNYLHDSDDRTAIDDTLIDERVFMAFAQFEARLKEYDRARVIYKFALDRLPRDRSAALHKAYTRFEKQFGDGDEVQDVVLARRRVHYEQLVRQSPKNYDNWIDYAQLAETAGDPDLVRDVYERAIAQMPPPTQEKRHWRRYIYLWLFYATWEELHGGATDGAGGQGDVERARQVYRTCLELVPHQHFTFAKVWLQAAYLEVRQGELGAARKLLGRAIGACPKDKLFRSYIELERRLFEFGRCRTLHQKWIEANPANCQAWIGFTELERGLDDVARARALFELAIAQPALNMPEQLWNEYIKAELDEGELDRVRALYERLLAKTDHVKVWTSYAKFEIEADEDDDDDDEDNDDEAPVPAPAPAPAAEDSAQDPATTTATAGAQHPAATTATAGGRKVSDAALARARAVFERAHRVMVQKELREERAALLAAWVALERQHGSAADAARVAAMQPRRMRRRRRRADGDGLGTGAGDDAFEEYVDYVFPADDAQTRGLSNVLAMAQKWKQTGGALAT